MQNSLKLIKNYRKKLKKNRKYASSLNHNVQSFLENEISPIFMRVESEEDLEFIKSISLQSLIEGNIVDDEKKISFK